MRAPKMYEGGINKVFLRIFNRDFYPHYPRIISNEKTGEDIRLIAKINN